MQHTANIARIVIVIVVGGRGCWGVYGGVNAGVETLGCVRGCGYGGVRTGLDEYVTTHTVTVLADAIAICRHGKCGS